MFELIKPKNFEDYFIKEEKPKAFVTLLFGDTASGKTFVSMSYPSPIFVIDTENRAISTKYYHYKNKDIKIFEPIKFKTTFNPNDEDPLDSYATINNISAFIIEFAKMVEEGQIKEGTIIVDSVSDIWSMIQDWAIHELAKYTTKTGERKADILLMKIKDQFDWSIPTNKHKELIGTLRGLIKKGIYIVFTAREQVIPDYAAKQNITLKDRIKCQKDVPFYADNIFYLKKVMGVNEVKYWAECYKLGGKAPPAQPVESLSFEKIKNLLEKIEV